jgi:micrococcal nuclease
VRAAAVALGSPERPARAPQPACGALALAVLAGCGFATAGTVPDSALRGPIPVPPIARETRVMRVVDGDTVSLHGLGSSRVIGVDTPEVYGGRECYGPEASAFARRVLRRGARVRYVPGEERRDRYGRPLVYLWLADGRSFNAMLAEGGYARTLTIAPNDRYAALLGRFERQARRHERGRWTACEVRDSAAARGRPRALDDAPSGS